MSGFKIKRRGKKKIIQKTKCQPRVWGGLSADARGCFGAGVSVWNKTGLWGECRGGCQELRSSSRSALAAGPGRSRRSAPAGSSHTESWQKLCACTRSRLHSWVLSPEIPASAERCSSPVAVVRFILFFLFIVIFIFLFFLAMMGKKPRCSAYTYMHT